MISFIAIENFRGINKGKIKGFAQLNVFIGKNNSGKSTILESLAISQNPDMLPDIVNRRGWHGLDTILSIFRSRDIKKKILIRNDNHKVEINHVISQAHDVEFLTKTKGFDERVIALNVKITKDRTFIKKTRVYFDSKGNYQNFVESKSKEFEKVFFIDHRSIYGKTLIDAYNLVFEHGYKSHERLMNVLNEVYPEIVDVRLFSEEVGPEIIYKHEKVPFFAMGDGFKSAYIYLTHLMNIENGYIICEEPENYQHPSSRKLIVRGIIKSAKRNQIFISTHSIELIDEILAETANIDIKFFVPNLDENGKLDWYAFDKEEAEFRRRELEADLRG